jgi:hypothetical protein
MRRVAKMVLYGLAGLAALAVVGIGVWVYVVQNVEIPAYKVVQQDGAFEIRDYPAVIVAEVTTRGDRRGSVNAGFRPLANYIFAKERQGDTIAMTAPVTQQRSQIAMTAPVTQSAVPGDGDSWTVQFIMPSKYTLADLPRPAGAQVQLKPMPAVRRASVRFSGQATDALIAAQEASLSAWLNSRGLTPTGGPTYAYYNDPFTPGPLRRNEVLFDLAPRP